MLKKGDIVEYTGNDTPTIGAIGVVESVASAFDSYRPVTISWIVHPTPNSVTCKEKYAFYRNLTKIGEIEVEP